MQPWRPIVSHTHTLLFFLKLLQRFQLVERISTAIDDFAHLNVQTKVAAAGCPRVTISMAELRSADGGLSQAIRLDPLRQMRALEAACHEVANEERPGYDKEGTYYIILYLQIELNLEWRNAMNHTLTLSSR
jgi:hypothetical protein